MEPDIRFRQSAFKHGVSEEDIRHAIQTARYVGLMDNCDNKYTLLGFDTKGNPLEVFYNEFGENGVNVFHAMRCRKEYYEDFE
jgi:hypothetical protein